jgi:hypothetical protein
MNRRREMALYKLVSLEPCDCCNATHEVATLSDIQAVLSDLGLVAVPIKDCTVAANTMEVRNSEEEASHHRFIDIDDAAQGEGGIGIGITQKAAQGTKEERHG